MTPSSASPDPASAGEGHRQAVAIGPATERDLPGLNRLINDPAVALFLDLAPPVPLDRTIDFYRYIQEQGGAWWVLRVGDALAGSVGLIPADPASRLGHTASLFIYLDPIWWGMGLGRRAVEAMIDEAERRGLVRLEVLVVEENERSLRLFEACGFTREGVRRAGFRAGDGYRDLLQLARVRC